MKPHLHLLAIALLAALPASATTYHVDGKSGDDARDGDAPATAWETLGHAVEMVLPGDTVIVHPGVYHEHVQLRRAGTAEQPIRFAADAIGKNRVVISGADPELRARKQPWKIEDQKLNIVHVKAGHRPARVLADDVDLFPYESLDELKTLTLKTGAPGPQQGYNVSFVPFAGGKAADPAKYEIFADGFAGGPLGPDANDKAAHRPTGIAQGPDGALYITDDKGGRVWRVVYKGPAK